MNYLLTSSRGVHVKSRPSHETLEEFLRRHFGSNYEWAEPACLEWMQVHSDMSREIASTATSWTWYELTNGGAFMSPEHESRNVFVQTPYYRGRFTVQAAAIVACLHTFNQLHFHHQGSEFDQHYRLLRRFAVGLAEAVEILDASEH